MITAIQEFEKEIKVLLKKSGVVSFSYTHVTGYKDLPDAHISSNWFASDLGESPSVLFYAFVPTEQVGNVINWVDEFNDHQESQSSIHVVALDVKHASKLNNSVHD